MTRLVPGQTVLSLPGDHVKVQSPPRPAAAAAKNPARLRVSANGRQSAQIGG
jgi:hypothetical protein